MRGRGVDDRGAGLTLRLAVPDDAPAIGRIRVAAWQAGYGEFLPAAFLAGLDPAANLDDLRLKLAHASDGFRVLVAQWAGAVVGFAILGTPRYGADEGSAELWALNVHPSAWRNGIGRALTLYALELAFAAGFKRLELWCIQGNSRACRCYENAGFTLAGRERINTALAGPALHEVLYFKKA